MATQGRDAAGRRPRTAEAESSRTAACCVARRLKAHGVTKLFTLSGGHLFSLYDGCRTEGIDLIDVRHESAAAFAAEGWAKVTREPGVCALTAGPGVTNGMSAIASAHKNNSPMVVLGGRAPQMRWGQGSLQEIDHVPFVRAAHRARRPRSQTADIPELVDEALATALRAAHRADVPRPSARRRLHGGRRAGASRRRCPTRAALPRGRRRRDRAGGRAARPSAERPVIMAGTDLYWGHGEQALRELSEALGIPVFLNGLARGCLPADHPNFFSRARGAGLKGADVALVIGVPMDFRLGFGGSLRRGHRDRRRSRRPSPSATPPRELAGELYGGLPRRSRRCARRRWQPAAAPRAHRRLARRRCARPRTRSAPARRPS